MCIDGITPSNVLVDCGSTTRSDNAAYWCNVGLHALCVALLYKPECETPHHIYGAYSIVLGVAYAYRPSRSYHD